jgi:signal transduction histidine kinase
LAALGSAVAKIAHDLRSSLASAQLVTERLAASDDPKVRQAAPRLERSILRAANLAEAALKFGKAEGPAPDLQGVHLANSLNEAAEEALPAPGAIKARIQADPALSALADSDHLHRILVNLLRNGAQAMERAGIAGEILVTARRTGAQITIDVADQGPGIPDGVRQKLFAPFASGNRERGGTGLGLAIARELARGMGGDLVLISTSAKGAIFRLTLRAAPAAIAAQ